MRNFFNKRRIVVTFILSLTLIVMASIVIIKNSQNVRAANMTDGIRKQSVTGNILDNKFIKGTVDFSVNLFANSTSMNKNTLVSPMSAYFALGMTLNGADGNTKKQFEDVLCRGTDTVDINRYYYTLSNKVTDDRDINSSCSIWYNKNYSESIKKEFLQKNTDYYNSNIYKTDFSKSTAARDINKWVSISTNNKIKNLVQETDDSDVMMLINTLYFNKKWQNPYKNSDITTRRFTNYDGTTSDAEFMHSIENEYLHDDLCEGFIKNYEGNKMSFACMLPKKDMSMEEYMKSLTGDRYIKYINSREKTDVFASMPKIKYDYSVILNDHLKKIGLIDAFDPDKADFAKMSDKNLCISKVLQKTYIDIGLNGTEAAAATEVEMKETAPAMEKQHKTVVLDRPFVFAIIDNETNLPLFMGVVVHI